MIYQTVDFNSFVNAFKKAGRGDQFSIDGLKMLFDWLEELYSGDNFELDVIGLCCGFAEYTMEEFLNDYYDPDGVESIEDLEQALIDGELDNVIAYDIENDIILVND